MASVKKIKRQKDKAGSLVPLRGTNKVVRRLVRYWKASCSTDDDDFISLAEPRHSSYWHDRRITLATKIAASDRPFELRALNVVMENGAQFIIANRPGELRFKADLTAPNPSAHNTQGSNK